MDHVQEIFIGGRELRWIQLEDPVNLIRPAQFAARQIQFPTAQLPQPLCFIEQILIALQLNLGKFALGDVGSYRDILYGLAFVIQGSNDCGHYPIQLTVLGPVANLAMPHLARRDSVIHLTEELLWMRAGIAYTMILSEQLFP